MITASNLYDYYQCPHKVWRDVNGPQNEKIDESNPFVELLWEKGVQHEKNVIEKIGNYLDLSKGSLEERVLQTQKAMENHHPLIYQGVIQHEDLLGIPDLLILENEQYYPLDIKSGTGLEGINNEQEADEGIPKRNYAVQIALYVDILLKNGWLSEKIGYIVDIDKNKVLYDLNELATKFPAKTYWEFYQEYLSEVRLLKDNKKKNLPAMASICKLCPWYTSCSQWAKSVDDLTQLYRCGRKNRDIFLSDLGVSSIQDFLSHDVDGLILQKKKDKSFLKGVGEKTLNSLSVRAGIFAYKQQPILYNDLNFPKVSYELFFDIEDDPTQDFVYIHGVYERSPKGERFIDFTATEISAESEKSAWAEFWQYIDSLPEHDYSVYYYSHHEKTTYLKLQKKYPDVISEEKVRSFFDNPNVIDLFRIVDRDTDWPVGSYSLKGLATYLGFRWRDETPSGALSIQWFNEYIKTKDNQILTRILEYNEDDCKATLVLKDALEKLSTNYS